MPTLFWRDRQRSTTKPAAITPHRGAQLAVQADGDYYPACKSPTSACRGGRLPCPSPDACRQAELVPDSTMHDPARGILCAIGITGACVLVGLLLVHWVAR